MHKKTSAEYIPSDVLKMCLKLNVEYRIDDGYDSDALKAQK